MNENNHYKIVDITNEYVQEGEAPIICRLFKLLVDDKCPFDELMKKGKKQHNKFESFKNQLKICLTQLIENGLLPPKKYKRIKSVQNGFELSIDRVRIYIIEDDKGGAKRIIINGQFNKTNEEQIKCIEKFKELGEKYKEQTL